MFLVDHHLFKAKSLSPYFDKRLKSKLIIELIFKRFSENKQRQPWFQKKLFWRPKNSFQTFWNKWFMFIISISASKPFIFETFLFRKS